MTVQQFGAGGPSTDFGQFGSKTASAPQTSQNPSVIMALAAWATGWTAAAVGAAFNPYLEDMNAFCLCAFYFLANLFERGVSDWDSGTTYYKGAVVQDPAGSGQQFVSLTDNNLNQALPLGASNAQWRWNNPPALVVGASATAGVIPKVTGATPAGGYTGTKATADSALSDDGVNVTTSLPIKFPDATIQTTAAVNNAPSVQTVVTGSRAINTVFHNATAKPIYCLVDVFQNGDNVQVLSDANPAPAAVVANAPYMGGAAGNMQFFFIVLPGNYYKVTMSHIGTLQSWTEWS